MILSFKKWLEVINQGGIVDKSEPSVTAMNVSGYASDTTPVTSKNRKLKIKKIKKARF
jgi:hypothetical protein